MTLEQESWETRLNQELHTPKMTLIQVSEP